MTVSRVVIVNCALIRRISSAGVGFSRTMRITVMASSCSIGSARVSDRCGTAGANTIAAGPNAATAYNAGDTRCNNIVAAAAVWCCT